MLPEAEKLFDQKQISITSRDKESYILECIDNNKSYTQKIKLSKTTIQKAECTCQSNSICTHLTAALLLLRQKKSKLQKTKRKTISNQNFVSQITPEDLEGFVISRMKADKDFKTLIQARFLVEVRGIEHFESYLDKAFPPTKTTTVTPAHKEVRLFQQVVDELQDQIKDLIGRDNHVAASAILTPLIKKSFYFKNRFATIPDAFFKSHLLLVEILKTIHAIIEAPTLKSQNAEKFINLLSLSYVELIHFKEKELVLNLLSIKSNKKKVLSVLDEKNASSHIKSYRQFLSALHFTCQTKKNRSSVDIGSIFVEIFSWQQNGHYYLDDLFQIAEQHDLPSRFIEKLLALSPQNDIQKNLQTDLALSNIKKHRSFSIFKWVFVNHKSKWLNSRVEIIQGLKENKDHHTLVKILIHEKKVDDLFYFLESISDINIYHTYIVSLLDLSRERTLKLYSNWSNNYLTNHYGQTALDEFDKQMRKVGTVDHKLRGQLDNYVLKKFGERPSINM